MKFNIDSTADMKAFTVLEIGSLVEILIGEKSVFGVASECVTTDCSQCFFNCKDTMVHKGFFSLCAYINSVVLINNTHMRALVGLEDLVE